MKSYKSPAHFVSSIVPTNQHMCLSKISRSHLHVHPHPRRVPSFNKFLPSDSTPAQEVITGSREPALRYDVIALNRRIIGFIRSNDLDSAFRVFRAMDVRTTVTWNSILAGYVKLRGNLECVQKLFDEIPQPDVVSYNIMLGRYLSEFGVNAAWEFFGKIPLRDVASWNTMISGYARCGRMEEARRVFLMMPVRNGVSWSAMISGYVDCGDLDSAVEMFGAATVKTVVAWTAMINGYMKFSKVGEAVALFEEMPGKSPVTWNALIAGYVENCLAEEALKAFRRMIESGVRLNPSTLCSALLGCSELSALQLGKQIHQFTVKLPVSEDTTTGTSLISMYCKCGVLQDAWKLFNGMLRRDVVTWNAMISGYAQHGLGKAALQMFDEMISEEFKPDCITFVAVLLACNHAGLIDLGRMYFRSMKRDFSIEPKLDHYSCMIDLLGRAGQLDEAVDLIQKMPCKPHPTIFGTLLGACRLHKNVELAEFASKSLLDLDPTSATAYIQLANVYAATKKFDEVSRIRKSMRESQVLKIPGYSWIEIGSTVHKFRSGDTDHPEFYLIRTKLNVLMEKIKLAGYVPDLEFALHDVGEEQKELLLLWHSEKLATTFGILKVPYGVPIRVFKNLRICGDCHWAIKYMSIVEGREIIVRDTSRFHHFVNGACSCGDYW